MSLDRLAVRELAHLYSLDDLGTGADTSVGPVLGVGHRLTRAARVERLDAAGFSSALPVHHGAVLGSVTSVVMRDAPDSVAVKGAPRSW
ncbi:hypothetical protein [Knoellia sp. Soil729]|uniref:hypothetical protein n=1 Tax=Knoellia sp. Soil729 TaxID=1736394 RepID=UPI0012E7A1CC|nr:hypothetical protein [Knoellia sp. Soil729]